MANMVIKNTAGTDSTLTFDRASNANWRIHSSGGNFYIQCDYTSSKGSYYDVMTLDYNTKAVNFFGDVNITKSAFAPLTITRSDSTYAAGIEFANSNGTLGYLALEGTANGAFKRYNSTASTSYIMLDTSNYNNYAPTKTGTGASGTWAINISGTAYKIRVGAPSSPSAGDIWIE